MDTSVRRLFDAYVTIYLACHRRHVRDDETGGAVTQHQISILDHLDEKRATTVSKLAGHIGIGRSAMSITVTRLVERGYIRKLRGEADGRSVGLVLTPKGSRVRNSNSVLDPDITAALLARMKPEERERTFEALELLASNARTMLQARSLRTQRGAR